MFTQDECISDEQKVTIQRPKGLLLDAASEVLLRNVDTNCPKLGNRTELRKLDRLQEKINTHIMTSLSLLDSMSSEL